MPQNHPLKVSPWILDNSVKKHMCNNKEQLHGPIWKGQLDTPITSAGIRVSAEGIIEGTITYTDNDNDEHEILLKNVIIVPNLKFNLISEIELIRRGYSVTQEDDDCRSISWKNNLVMTAKLKNGLYVLPLKLKTENIESLLTNHKTIEEEQEELANHIRTEPENWKDIEQLYGMEKELWLRAMQKEMDIMTSSKILTEATPGQAHRIIGSRWTFATKRNDQGVVKKIRARLVAKGFGQRPGIDFMETYSPVVKHTTIRVLLTMSAQEGLETRHYDISSAFLYGDLEEEIYMRGPLGPGEEVNKVYRVNKSLYGLKQAAHNWNVRINSSLLKLNFTSSENDPCLYSRFTGEEKTFIIIHVDDLLVIGNNLTRIHDTVKGLEREYDIKDLGVVACYLGISVIHNLAENVKYLHQVPLINKLISDNELMNSKPTHIPMCPDYQKGLDDSKSKLLTNNQRFQSLIGSLLYISIITRPDIHLSVNILGRRVQFPTEMDWEAAKRIVKFLNTTKHKCLRLGGKGSLTVESYCDADGGGGDIASRKSTSGQLHYLGFSLIDWKTRKQSCVALSSCEAEFISASQAAQELCWIQRIISDLRISISLPTLVNTDSQSCIAMTDSPKLNRRSKHIKIKYMYLRDLIKRKFLTLKYCPTDQMPADAMTKPLARPAFEMFSDRMGMIMLGDFSLNVVNKT